MKSAIFIHSKPGMRNEGMWRDNIEYWRTGICSWVWAESDTPLLENVVQVVYGTSKGTEAELVQRPMARFSIRCCER